MNDPKAVKSLSQAAIMRLAIASKITKFWPFRRFNEHFDSLLYGEVGLTYFLQKDYGQAEYFLLEALRLNPSNYIAWHYLGLLFAEGDQRSYQAEQCHHRVLWLEKEQKISSTYIASSRTFLVNLGLGDPDNLSICERDNAEAALKVDKFLRDWPRDLPRLGDSRIPVVLELVTSLDPPDYLGNPNCINNAQSRFLQCAVNPTGDCSSCKDFEELLLPALSQSDS